MSKKLNWLDQFAEEQAKKLQKTASLNKKAEQVIVSPDDVPGAVAGNQINYNNEMYKVVDANYQDEVGAGVILEKVAAIDVKPEEETEVPVEKAEDAPIEEPVEKKEEEFGDDVEIADEVTPAPAPAAEVAPIAPAAPMAAPTTVAPVTQDTLMQTPTGAPVAQNPVVPMNPAAPAANAADTKKVTDAPEMARTNPGDVYHIEVRDTVELDKAKGEAAETAGNIAGEDAIDVTTPEGRQNRILQKMVTMMSGNALDGMNQGMPTYETLLQTPTGNFPSPSYNSAPVAPIADPMGIPATPVAPVETPAAPVAEEVPAEPVVEEAPAEDEKKNEEKVAKVASNKKVIAMSDRIAKAIELEFEEILADAEEVVKTFVPARKVKAVLTKMEAALEAEGIEALFDKKVTREALRKTAAEETTDKELMEFVEKITKSIIDEAEEILKDADDVADETVAQAENKFEVESKLKAMLEKKMAAKGIYCKLGRNQKKAGNSILAKIKASQK